MSDVSQKTCCFKAYCKRLHQTLERMALLYAGQGGVLLMGHYLQAQLPNID